MKKSELFLFLSADIVGSTAYKHNNRETNGKPQPWLEFFRGFYQDFPTHIAYRFSKTPEIPRPSIWKTAGDELLFTVQVNCHKQVLGVIHAFHLAMHDYGCKIKEKSLPLGIKGCAWVAGFPIINAKVRPNKGDEDYIGPLIDAGFRLTKYSSERKFVVSVETALLLTTALSQNSDLSIQLTLYFDGKETLKGVLSERPYPIIWVDMCSGVPPSEERLKGYKREAANTGELQQFCREYIQRAEPDLVIPYMEKCSCPDFQQIPEIHQKILNDMKNDPQTQIEVGEEPRSGEKSLEFQGVLTVSFPPAPPQETPGEVASTTPNAIKRPSL